MHLRFYKYHGTGNDFILVDNRTGIFLPDIKIISLLCDRRMGVGADGLILMNHSSQFNFSMRYFNADGHESSMCGNGGRCLVAFARKLGIPDTEFTFEAIDGVHHAMITGETGNVFQVRLQMKDVLMPETVSSDHIIDTGSPHLVRMVKGLSTLDVRKQGRKIRNSALFKEQGVNVNFVEIRGETTRIRTYERGVEEETLSCGTGAVASALMVALHIHVNQGPVILQTLGGELAVHFKRTKNLFHDIWLEGPASFVFQGNVII